MPPPPRVVAQATRGRTPPAAGKLPRRSKPSAAVAAHRRAAAAARGGAQQSCCPQPHAPSTRFPFPPSEPPLSMVVGGRRGRIGSDPRPPWPDPGPAYLDPRSGSQCGEGLSYVLACRGSSWAAALWLSQGAARGGVSC